jgi:hypothetical protein
MHVQAMIATHPHGSGATSDALTRCIEACFDCAQTCTSCADACLGEAQVQHLTQCIRLNADCADACLAAGSIASRRTGSNQALARMMVEACAEACRACGAECRKHAEMHEHCRICADACKSCEEACRDAARGIASAMQ